jgi:HK97 family phage major capsid protein
MATPTTSAELERQLTEADPAKIAADPKGFGELVKNYQAASIANYGEQLRSEIAEQTQATLADMARDLKAEVAAPKPGVNYAKGYNAGAVGAKLDGVYENSLDFVRTTWHGNAHRPEVSAKLARVRNDYGTQVPADGGFLVPESLRSTLLEVALESAFVRSRATVVPMESQRVPFPTIDSTSNASSVHGGLIGYWTEESAALTESQATFGRVVLDAKKLTGYSEVPNELFADSILSFDALLGRLWPEAIAHFEDVAFFRGTGVGEPLGFLNAPSAVSVTKETGQAADTIVWENLVKAYARMLPTSIGNAIWIANIDTFPELATMALSVGTGGAPVWHANGASAAPLTILGRPVYFTEKAATLGDAGDINFVDLSYYLVGDRQQMTMSTSPHFKFQNDQTAVRIIERVDGRPWLQTAITPNQGSNTLSPFVKIAARA